MIPFSFENKDKKEQTLSITLLMDSKILDQLYDSAKYRFSEIFNANTMSIGEVQLTLKEVLNQCY